MIPEKDGLIMHDSKPKIQEEYGGQYIGYTLVFAPK